MPKDEKDGGKKKRSKATPGKQSNNTPKVKKRKVEKITRSKQLEAKLTKTRPKQPRKSQVNQPSYSGRKTCVNGKPMPSLAELERMFETSSEDEEEGPTPSRTTSAPQPSRCNTPETPIVIGVDQLASPTTIREISEKVIDFISNLPDTIVLDDDPPSPPPKKRKKPDVAYIERTKDCTQLVGYKSNAVVGAGDNYKRKFIDTEISNDESLGRKRRSQIKDPCTSIFNTHAEEIAAKLKAVEAAETHSNSSADSNKTIPYDCTPVNRIYNFSPIPSTSTDTETFLINDDRFNESLRPDETNNKSFAFNENNSADNDNDTADTFEIHSFDKNEPENDVEIVEQPCETIMVDDEGSNSCSKSVDIEIVKPKYETPIVIEDTIGDLYSSIINLDDYNDADNDVCEVIDVDDIIAENQAVLSKYKISAPRSITCVDLNDTADDTSNDIELSSNTDISVVSNPHREDVMQELVKNFFQNRSPSDLTSPYGGQSTAVNTMGNIPPRPNALSAINPSMTNSVILDNTCTCTSVPDFMNPPIYQRTRAKAKKQTKKNKPPIAPTPVPPSPTTDERENVTPRRLGDCPICFENLSNQAIASTICGHLFCMPCIKTSIKASGKKCPACRKSLKGVGYHQIFI